MIVYIHPAAAAELSEAAAFYVERASRELGLALIAGKGQGSHLKN